MDVCTQEEVNHFFVDFFLPKRNSSSAEVFQDFFCKFFFIFCYCFLLKRVKGTLFLTWKQALPKKSLTSSEKRESIHCSLLEISQSKNELWFLQKCCKYIQWGIEVLPLQKKPLYVSSTNTPIPPPLFLEEKPYGEKTLQEKSPTLFGTRGEKPYISFPKP